MTKIGFITDTASDILRYPDIRNDLGLDAVIYQYVNIGDKTYTDKTLSLEELRKKMETAGKENWPKTSQPAAGVFVKHYEKLKEEGFTDIISVHVAHKRSGTMNSARLAGEQVADFTVHLVDSQMASIGMIPTLFKTKELLNTGLSPEEISVQANEYAKSLTLYAAVPKLDNLYKGGRLKPIRYRLGKLFKFKPILIMKQSEIESIDKTRNLQKTQNRAYEYAVEQFGEDEDFQLIIAHGWDPELAHKFVDRFENEYPGRKYHVGEVGPSIGVHLGPQGIVFCAFKL